MHGRAYGREIDVIVQALRVTDLASLAEMPAVEHGIS